MAEGLSCRPGTWQPEFNPHEGGRGEPAPQACPQTPGVRTRAHLIKSCDVVSMCSHHPLVKASNATAVVKYAFRPLTYILIEFGLYHNMVILPPTVCFWSTHCIEIVFSLLS